MNIIIMLQQNILNQDIVSTINVDFQDVAQKALKKSLKFHEADWGTVVLMEVESGHVKAIAN